MSAADSPNDLDIIRLAIRNQLARVRTAIPAEILKYDADTQLANVQVLIRSTFVNAETDVLETYLPPPIPNVQVGWQQTSKGALTFPVAVGDQGFLIVAERSIDEWKQTGGRNLTPRDKRRFDLSDGFFLPVTRPIPQSLPNGAVDPLAVVLFGDEIKLGDSGASDFVALASLVITVFSTLKTWLDTHTHVGVLTGAGVSGPPAPPSPAPTAVAAVKVKAK